MPEIQTKAQVSAGGVVYQQNGQTIEVVLISVGENNRWQLPKGIINRDEAPEDTAVREVREETGLETAVVTLIDKIEYWYYATSRGKRVRFHKVVHFYLLQFLSGDTQNHDHEVNEARWLEIDQAQEQLTFKSEKNIVAKAKEMILQR